MKKRRISRKTTATKEKIDAAKCRDGEEIQCSGHSFADLPRSLLVIIFLKLSVKRIVICKCVCKAWRDLISDPEFSKLHFGRAESYPLIRTSDSTRVSRILYLLQAEKSQDFNPEFECYCDESDSDESDSDYAWCRHRVNTKLETKLKFPLRNMELVFDDRKGENCNSEGMARRKQCIKVRPMHQRYRIVNSCNGLLCLSEPTRNIPLVVCNPVTSEFVNLPETQVPDDPDFRRRFVHCGLGISPSSNQYKVIRMFDHFIHDAATGKQFWDGRVAEVLTLGNGSWKNIGSAPHFLFERVRPVYLNGALHWFHQSFYLDSIISFTIEDECFKSFSPPPERLELVGIGSCNISMGVLGGCLCICDASNYCPINVWVMKVYGVGNSWTKMLSIDTLGEKRWPYGLYQPIKEMKNGALLFFDYPKSAMIYHHPDKIGFKYYRVRGVKAKFEAITHTPSFIPLKDALQGGGEQVLNVYSRCGKLKVPGEARTFCLVEEDRQIEIDTENSDEDYNDSSDQWD